VAWADIPHMFYSVQRMWTSLLVIGIPAALLAAGWAIFMGGRPVAGELAGCYLLIVIAGRAQAAERERRAKPVRAARVRTQLDRVRSTVVSEEPERQPHAAAL
jgi:hypothetical protein